MLCRELLNSMAPAVNVYCNYEGTMEERQKIFQVYILSVLLAAEVQHISGSLEERNVIYPLAHFY